MNVLVVDVGGSHVKILATGQDEPRKFSSGSKMAAEEMVSGVDELDSQNMLIGVQQECMSVEPEHGRAIEVGDHLMLFTDGLPETRGADGQMLGDDRLIELAMASHCRSAANMADCILERERASGGGAQRDDLTLIIAEFTS